MKSIRLEYIPLGTPIAGGVTIIPRPSGAAYGAGETNLEKHVHRFRNGMVATLVFDMRGGQLHRADVHWNKDLTRKRVQRIYGEYTAWRDEAFRQLAEKYGHGSQLIIDLPAADGTNPPVA